MSTQTVQITEITATASNSFQVCIICCYCGKKHFHGTSQLPSGGSLGKRIPHCNPMRFVPEYELMIDAWVAAGKSVKQLKKNNTTQ